MSDTTEMVRIIRHAADRLSKESPTSNMSSVELASLTMAMGYAESVLRMVAACMEPESEPNAQALARVRAFAAAAADASYVRTDDLLEVLAGDGGSS